MKIVGNDKTHMNPAADFTPEQFDTYSNTEPLDILEEETEDGYRYHLRGCWVADNLTADQVAEFFNPAPHWFAVLKDADDSDWGYGSFDFAAAVEMANRLGPDAYIAEIDAGYENGVATCDPICVEEHYKPF